MRVSRSDRVALSSCFCDLALPYIALVELSCLLRRANDYISVVAVPVAVAVAVAAAAPVASAFPKTGWILVLNALMCLPAVCGKVCCFSLYQRGATV